MSANQSNWVKRLWLPIFCMAGFCLVSGLNGSRVLGAAPQAAATSKAVGTLKSISGNSIVLTAEGGTDTNVIVQDGARLLQIEPGETDLKKATPLQLSDLQPGDRILVRGGVGPDGKSILAASVIAMKKADLAAKRAHDQAEWQRNGIGGLVSAVDPSAGTITVATSALSANKNVLLHVSKNTVLRRYAPGSVKFDDAVPAPIDQVKPGDQLRARGQKSPDSGELKADEIVSGSFRNISGTINSVDAAANTITVEDLTTKKPVVVKIADTSQLRKLPAPMAQRIAARLKGNGTEGAAGAGAAGARGGAAGQGGDLQQAITRMPASKLSDLQKGDAVMIVATSSSGTGAAESVVAITLLSGVEPILQASPSGQSILTPWTMSSAPGGDTAQ